MTNDFLKISIVIPTHNEKENIKPLYDRLNNVFESLNKYKFDVLFIDDSSDSTSDEIIELIDQDDRVNLIKLTRKFGQSIAIAAGLDNVNSDAIIMMDADLQDPPECIPEFIKYWEDGYKVVCARRKSSSSSFLYSIFSFLFYKLQENISSTKIPSNVGEFRLIDKSVLNIMVNFREKTRFMRGLTLWPGFKSIEIDIVRPERKLGVTNYNFNKSFLVALDGLVSFSIAPLRFALIIGFVMFTLSIIGILYVIVPRLLDYRNHFQLPSGGTLLTIVLLLFGGIQFILLGIIGEYIGRIFNEIIDRPIYVIEYKYGKNLN